MTWSGVELVLSGPAEDALFAEMLPLGLRQRVNGWRLGLQETGRLVAGIAFVRRTPELRRVLAAAAVVMAVSGVEVAAQYSLVQAAGEPPAFLGVLSACLGGGSIAASLVSSRLLRHLGEGWLAVLGMIDFAAGSALRATGVLACAVLGTVVLGFALPWVFLAVVNLAQRLTPLFLQGRVSAAVTLAMFGPQAPMQAWAHSPSVTRPTASS